MASLPPQPALSSAVRADIAVVGAGYTGLVAALCLAKFGLRVVVADAGRVGAGASGVNGGQVVPGFKIYPGELMRRFGAEAGMRLVRFGSRAVDCVEQLVSEHRIACDFRRCAWIQPAHAPGRVGLLRDRFESLLAIGADVGWLGRDETAAMLGTSVYHEAWIDRRAAALHPYAYVTGLAERVIESGATIYEQTRVESLDGRAGAYVLKTECGSIVAGHVIVATNGYSDGLIPGLAASLVPVESAQVATEPLSADLRRKILPSGATVSDSRRSLIYFRLSDDGRLLLGGRGGIAAPTREMHFARLRAMARRIFPQLEGVGWNAAWSGRIAMTADSLPHLHEPRPGVLASVGCNGRGIGLASAVGHAFAQRILGGAAVELPLPVRPIRPGLLAPFRRVGASVVGSWYGLRDHMDRLVA